ncbi:hypothetical protein M0R45_034068 [Rubus argutus]|uniref:Uncharacterized protein n=1 Tax=Rubus argutus TaxID=59490 RepID=A0AAW1VP73_RUBAR
MGRVTVMIMRTTYPGCLSSNSYKVHERQSYLPNILAGSRRLLKNKNNKGKKPLPGSPLGSGCSTAKPRIVRRASGIRTADCCSGTCADLDTDRNDCGFWGHICPTNDICCGGHCVNPRTDNSNCGMRNNTCKVLSFCENGFCHYA